MAARNTQFTPSIFELTVGSTNTSSVQALKREYCVEPTVLLKDRGRELRRCERPLACFAPDVAPST